ncbi:DUF1801 domain-containing protein [Nocardia sp. NPDC051832]|uniref:DUF1801 domain-containing protein n=1 Tax=Nocardia sp. NPDC051832 TaxID=3155673 RepID=UPI0034247B0D
MAKTVEQFLAESAHPRKPEIEELRAAILGAHPGITEQIKWNAPSFCVNGDDRVTMRLQPGDAVELIFHRGVKVKDTAFSFEDPAGLLHWRAPDRGTVTFTDLADVQAKLPSVVELVDRWMTATAE